MFSLHFALLLLNYISMNIICFLLTLEHRIKIEWIKKKLLQHYFIKKNKEKSFPSFVRRIFLFSLNSAMQVHEHIINVFKITIFYLCFNDWIYVFSKDSFVICATYVWIKLLIFFHMIYCSTFMLNMKEILFNIYNNCI